MWATFDRFEIQMTLVQAQDASHAGSCDADVAALLLVPAIRRQLDRIGSDAIREELRGYGCWTDEELADDDANRARIVWIAAGRITDERGVGYGIPKNSKWKRASLSMV